MATEVEAVNALYVSCAIEADQAREFKTEAHIREAEAQFEIAEMLRELHIKGPSEELQQRIGAHPLADWALEWIEDYMQRNS